MLVETEIPVELVFQQEDFSDHFPQEFHHGTSLSLYLWYLVLSYQLVQPFEYTPLEVTFDVPSHQTSLKYQTQPVEFARFSRRHRAVRILGLKGMVSSNI